MEFWLLPLLACPFLSTGEANPAPHYQSPIIDKYLTV
jgi:hypothetical protein